MKKHLVIGVLVLAGSVYNFIQGKQDFDNANSLESTLTLENIMQTTSETEKRLIKFAYDAAGNRISRTITLLPNTTLRSAKNEASTEEVEVEVEGIEEPEVHSEVINETEIRIYPNPTRGMLKVEIDNLPSGNFANILLYDLSGRLIEIKQKVEFSTEFNLVSQPAGTYIMKITAEGVEQTSWKIIKQ
ncbi:MAG: T9SS type A sorting domain-containing protein [Dysgonamonadaceae bacterium]|jgi:YD repeat-containing protein|nr:T9SS type A sorting domain-containing protein [Dysgonamonadaceae bacterium]